MFKKVRFLSLFTSLVLTFFIALLALPAHALGNNLVPNPSLEQNVSSKPTSWSTDQWGTNTTTFSYTNSGSHSGTYSVTTKMTARSSGDAKWYFAPITVAPNTSYTISDWYKSTVRSNVDLEVTTTTGAVTYYGLDTPASSANVWKQSSYTFTTPANAAKLTVLHSLDAVGSLTTDDYSVATTAGGTTTPTAPTVSLTAPAANSTVSGTVNLSAMATDAKSITSVQFKLDGTVVGAPDTTSPYSITWDSKTVANGTHSLTAMATNSSSLTTTSNAVSITVNNPITPPVSTTPTVSVTAPANGSSISGTTTVTASASDTTPLAGVQFKLDGINLGSEDTTAPYSIAWDTTTTTNNVHILTAVARNTAGGSATSSNVSVTVNNPTAPTVSVTAPAASSTINGTVALSATAADAQAITSIQFQIDGTNVGVADTTAPYSINWDSTSVANGSHRITAVATNTSNLRTTSTPVAVTVNNVATPPPVVTPPAGANLLANPSLETSQDGVTPASWLASNWGTNTSTFSYLSTGHTGSRSVEVQTTSYTNGAANWFYNEVPVSSGKTYQYSNWYKSNVDTEVDAEVTMTDGTVQYFWLGSVFANTAWTQFKTTFTPPAGAKSMAIYQILGKVGYIISDDYSLNEYTPLPYTRPIVSVTFDDGWTNQYTNAYPVMAQLGLPATYYIISGSLQDQPDYMTGQQIKNLYANGNEIGSHTITHSDMTTLGATQLQNEFANSQITLQNLIGAPVTDFAYPYGAYNFNTITIGKKYYVSQRSVNGGLNTRDNLDVTQLKIQEVDSNISQAQVQGWIDSAIANHAWLILCYHEVAAQPSVPDDALYTTSPTDFTAEMNYLKKSNVSVQTVKSALAEVQSQQ